MIKWVVHTVMGADLYYTEWAGQDFQQKEGDGLRKKDELGNLRVTL